MLSFVFLAVGSTKNKAGNVLFCMPWLLGAAAFSLFAERCCPVCFWLPVAGFPYCRHVNVSSVATQESDFYLFIVFLYFDVFICSFLSNQELSCPRAFRNSLVVLLAVPHLLPWAHAHEFDLFAIKKMVKLHGFVAAHWQSRIRISIEFGLLMEVGLAEEIQTKGMNLLENFVWMGPYGAVHTCTPFIPPQPHPEETFLYSRLNYFRIISFLIALGDGKAAIRGGLGQGRGLGQQEGGWDSPWKQ